MSHINTETLRVHDKITREGKWWDPHERKREREDRRRRRIRRGMIYTCQSRMFLCIGEAPSMIVAHVSCSIVPCIAATHEIALCMHIHTDNTDAHCAAPALPAATIQTDMLYREKAWAEIGSPWVRQSRQGRPLNSELYWNNRSAFLAPVAPERKIKKDGKDYPSVAIDNLGVIPNGFSFVPLLFSKIYTWIWVHRKNIRY